ncbi:MAG TPA: LamG domain-containing protein [Candidatus Bathyarchaeia archaeon]|nr:LamG domain-containing protein [Candidatus Bathyarchaeia archaeon]
MAPPILVPAIDFTVAAWFRWTANPSPYYSGIQGGGYSWELRIMADGRFAATFYQSIGPDVFTEIVSPLAYNDGTWHHAAAVLRSGLVELYVDGVLVARDTTNPITSVRSSTLTQVAYVASYFVGDIDEVRVFTRALTAGEIAALSI